MSPLDLGPYHLRRVVCSYCRRSIQDGNGPTVWGQCIPCGDRIARERAREEREMWRRKARRPAQTPEELAAAGDPFEGFEEED